MSNVQKYMMAWTTADGRRITDQLFTAEHISHKLAELESANCRDILVESITQKDITKPEVIYTGGGIWLAVKRMENDPHIYAVVDDFWENCVTYYDDRYDDYEFACQQMVDSRADDEMSDADKVLYKTLYAALKRESY